MEKLKFDVSLEEAKIIFKALGKLPFEDVFELIGKLNEQLNQQLIQDNGKAANSLPFEKH